MNSSPEAVEQEVKEVHRRFPTGVTIVTAAVQGVPYGLAVNAFSSVSLDPPVVLVCVAATSSTHPHLFTVDHLGVNILAETQEDLLKAFARSGGDKFAEVAWHEGPNGSPILEGCSAVVELEIEKRLQAYTHTIFIGRVVMAKAASQAPLVYLSGDLFPSSNLRSMQSRGVG